MTNVNFSLLMRQLSFPIQAEVKDTDVFHEKCIKNKKVRSNCIHRYFAVRRLAVRAYNPINLA